MEEERHSKSMHHHCPYMMQGMSMDPNMMYPQQMQQPMGCPGMMNQQQMQQPMGMPGMMGQMDQSMGYPTGRDDEEQDVFAEDGYRYVRPYYPHHTYHPYMYHMYHHHDHHHYMHPWYGHR